MYTMKADGVVFYDPSSTDVTLQVLSPRAKYALNEAETLEFTMLPDNVAYNSLNKLKTVVTLEQDGEEIFRGRVLETETDLYNQKKVYCEGELNYLLDSLVRPYEYKGTAKELLNNLIADHNAQVDSDKQFQIGSVTAITDTDEVETESSAYVSTLSEIRQMLVNPFGGYLRVRMVDGVRYLDYVSEFTDTSGQAIEFGVNLVDVSDKVEATDVFTVLVPLGGYDTKNKDPVTIASVNNGLDYIEDEEAIAKYGRIVKTYKWEELTDPQAILDKGKEHFAKMKEARTLTLKAVDLHVIDTSVDSIRFGDQVKLTSSPHGLDMTDVCSKLELEIERPDQSEYTFGIPLESLTDKNASSAQRTSVYLNKLEEWLTVTDSELTLAKQSISRFGDEISNVLFEMDAVNAAILLKADQTTVDGLTERVSQAEIDIDGANAAIALKANQATVDGLEIRTTSAEAAIDGLNASIKLKAEASTVNEQGVRLSAAELSIDGLNSEISAKADKTSLKTQTLRIDAIETTITGLVTMDEFEAFKGGVSDLWADELRTSYVGADSVVAGYGDFDELVAGSYSGHSSFTLSMGGLVSEAVLSKGAIDLSHSHKVTVSDDGTVTLGEVSETGGNFKIADTKAYKDGVSAAYNDGKSDWRPTIVQRTGVDTTNKTVTVSVSNLNQTLLTDQVVSAVEIFDTAWEAGYSSGYSIGNTDGYESGYNTGYSSGKSDWRPTIVTRTGVDTTNKTVTVSVSNLNQTLLTGQVVSAVEVYDAGYNAGSSAGYSSGYSAGYAAAINSLAWSVSGTNVVATFGDGSTKSTDVKSYVKATADVKYVSSTSTTITVRGWAYAYFNSVSCASVYKSATYDTAD